MTEIVLAVLFGPLLWLIGAIVFDGVHWVLHLLLRSRVALLRGLAWPHAVHHRWIDRNLDTNCDLQSANVWCHIVPEYVTQLVVTAAVAWLLPLPFAAVLGALQTLVFLGILRTRGRDINHRPVARVDAHPAGWLTPPSYHLLHHAWPDAHFSSYTKAVDRLVGGGAQIAERRFAWVGPDSALGTALRRAVEAAGGVTVAPEPLGDVDVLVLLDPEAPLAGPVEPFLTATRGRQLPPEVWALRSDAADPVARHYRDDVRVCFRTLHVAESERGGPAAARRALWRIRRDAHYVDLERPWSLSSVRRFLRTSPEPPAGAELVHHRLQLASKAQGRGIEGLRRLR